MTSTGPFGVVLLYTRTCAGSLDFIPPTAWTATICSRDDFPKSVKSEGNAMQNFTMTQIKWAEVLVLRVR